MDWEYLSYTDQCRGGIFMMKGLHIRDRNLFLGLFLSGFVVGVFYITIFGKAAVHSTTLMSTYFFSK